MKFRTILTQERLKELLHYDEDTGEFTWKVSRGGLKKGSLAGNINYGYIRIKIGGKNYEAHRLVWLYVFGSLPLGWIDHINGLKHDNRLCNLREATPSQNAHNTRLSKRNSSGVKGVSFNRKKNQWVAFIKCNYKNSYLGSFKTIKEASEAIKIKREELHKDFANHG